MDSSTKEKHDLLLSVMPEGAVHDTEACQFCTTEPATATASGQDTDRTEGGVLDVSITQEDINKAVADATSSLEAELSELRKYKADVESSEAAMTAQEKIEAAETAQQELQTKLDAATIEATEAKTKYDELVAWLASEAERAQHEAEVAALREERAEAIKALKVFPEEYVEENAQRYAEMDEETFNATVEDYKAAKAAKVETETEDEELPTSTAFVATRDDDGTGTKSHLGLMRLRNQGVDLGKIR